MGKCSTGRPVPCCAQYHRQWQNSPNPLSFQASGRYSKSQCLIHFLLWFFGKCFQQALLQDPRTHSGIRAVNEMLLHLPVSLPPSSVCALDWVPQRVHTAVTLFLLIFSPPGSSEERCVWQAARAGLPLVCRRADPSLACTLPSATCWKGRQRGKEAAWRSSWPSSFALLQSACPPRDDSQGRCFPNSYFFPRGASAALSGLRSGGQT